MSEQDRAFEWPQQLALDDEAGPAAFLSPTHTDALIFGALDQAGPIATRGDRISGVSRAVRAEKPGIGTRSLAAAALLALFSVGSASAAFMYFGKRAPSTPSAAVAPANRPSTGRQTPRAAVVDTAPAPAQAPVVEPTQAAAPDEKPSSKHGSVHAPDDLLSEGNRLRAARRWAKADEAYTRAALEAPRSQTAYVARVASAGVRLEHLHDARGALTQYRAALQQLPDGPLREEVQWGIADSYRALGDRASERAALLMFVREHPRSPLRKQAEARLD